MGLKSVIVSMFGDTSISEPHSKRQLMCGLESSSDAVVVIDYTLFDFRSIDDFRILIVRFPHVRWLLFSTELSESFIRQAVSEPNVSIILKENSEVEIRQALDSVYRGERFLCRQISESLQAMPGDKGMDNSLTPSEVEILRLTTLGLSVKEIATRRVSSVHTIITHKKNIFRKLGVNNVHEATKYALRAGLVEMSEYYI
ncbi:MAG: response regulator transcription factor [Pseudoflavonifractor sp.]|nr:response regulator transcription factor [Pseudoflavonifractor sp.]